jgi:hypothetical protein
VADLLGTLWKGSHTGPTFLKPSPWRRQVSSRSTRPSHRLASSQHWAGKNQPCPECSSFTITWLTNQLGEHPRLSCQRQIFWSGPSWSEALVTHTKTSLISYKCAGWCGHLANPAPSLGRLWPLRGGWDVPRDNHHAEWQVKSPEHGQWIVINGAHGASASITIVPLIFWFASHGFSYPPSNTVQKYSVEPFRNKQ